jgi:hypothetical protein
VNDALQAAMLLAEPELVPDPRTTALDEILAVRVLVGSQVDHLLGPISFAVPLDEAAKNALAWRRLVPLY